MKKNLALIATVAAFSALSLTTSANASFFDDIKGAFNKIGNVVARDARPLLDQVHGMVKHGIDAVNQGLAKLSGPAAQAGRQFLDNFVKRMSADVRALSKQAAAFGKGLMTHIQKSVNAGLAQAQKLGRQTISQLTKGKATTLSGLTQYVRGYFEKAFGKARDIAKGTAKHVVGTFQSLASQGKRELDKILIGLNKSAQAAVVKVAPPKGIVSPRVVLPRTPTPIK